MSVSRGQDKVALDLCVDDLANDVRVGETNDKAILGRVILVLVLNDQALASIVVSLALASAAVLDLVALEVGLVLDSLDERLQHHGRTTSERGMDGWAKYGWYHCSE